MTNEIEVQNLISIIVNTMIIIVFCSLWDEPNVLSCYCEVIKLSSHRFLRDRYPLPCCMHQIQIIVFFLTNLYARTS